MTQHSGSGPLDGIVVADFSRVLAGPYATMMLADLGATVIKVEAPRGDDTRYFTPPSREGVSTYYLSVNRNKYSIVLDLCDPEDLETAYQILDRADVFVENFKPGSLGKFGLAPKDVAARWPEMIHASITGFGMEGGAELPGYDLLVQALSGLMHVTGSADGPPQRAGVAIFDVITGMHATIGILGALQERHVSGRGQRIVLDLLSSAQSALVNQTTGNVACGNEPMRMGNEHPSLYPYGPFGASDRDIIICIGNDTQFTRFCEQLGMPEVAEDERYRTVDARNRNRASLKELIEERLGTKTAAEWFAAFRAVKIACAPIFTVGEGVDFAEGLGLHPVVKIKDGDDEVPLIKSPIRYSRSAINYRKAPPRLGADNQSVREWLGQTAPRVSAQVEA
ncbi:carnitine dehydratase [Corynebacterium yudongzhengii]|uniref:CoA transferase n=1 Tax=Corynebacterium yudongzhengii TaxID=2080740 RepID=A0A2U1T897_9CORY|nr:CoA transferase [Corynebacterium yudongzhengii]AWB82730.1 carnitine dehydratase [Corynebacterium yudongzhengii]PWC02209.1 CoA transferase [Corynebacterium yudongzhengii]